MNHLIFLHDVRNSFFFRRAGLAPAAVATTIPFLPMIRIAKGSLA